MNRFKLAGLVLRRAINKCGFLAIATLLAIGVLPAMAQIPLNGVNQVMASALYTCALTNNGSVECWGNNDLGHLGNGSFTPASVAVNTRDLSTGVLAISAKANHSCAIIPGGGVKCWGNNSNGELGNSSITYSTVPVDVVGLGDPVIAVATGAWHTCILNSNGGVKCWGNNSYGQLGDGTTIQKTTPTQVSNLSQGVVAISVGYTHTCVLTNSGSVKCWGQNSNGQLGNNSRLNKLVPTDVSGLSNSVLSISAGGEHTCANGSDGVKCWGSNNSGQLGDYSVTESLVPIAVMNLPGEVSELSAGGAHTCAIVNNGNVLCWGSNSNGQLGDDTTAPVRWTPVSVSQVNDAVKISAGGQHTCIINSSESVKCWGHNYYGQLGNGTTAMQSLTAVQSLQAFAPRIGTATPGNTQAIVRFSPPTNDSGSPITGYTVISNPRDGIDAHAGTTISHTGPDELSHLVTGLRNGVTYRFTVTATNALGTGLPSAVSNSVIPTATSSSGAASSSISGNSSISSSSISSEAITSSSAPASSSSISSVLTSSSVASSLVASSSSIPMSSSSAAISSVGSVDSCFATSVTFGITSSGNLTTNDCTAGARGVNYYTDRYSFTGTPGQQIAIQLSGSFDTFVNLKNPDGTVIASNDDGGGGTNSRIPATSGNFTIPAGTTGTYVIEVTSYSTFATGSYSLTVTSAAASSSSSSAVITSSSSSTGNPCSSAMSAVSGVTNAGTLATTDCNTGARGAGYYTDRYEFTGTSGQLIAIQLTSSAFDSYLYLRNPSGVVITSNDDGGGGTNSRIPATSGNFTLSASGTYIIEVTSYSTSRTGAYSLLLTRQ